MLYFIRAEGTLMVKIGYTKEKTAKNRKNHLQCGCPHALFVEATCHGSLSDELAIHKALRNRQVREGGEWFYLTKDEVNKIINREHLPKHPGQKPHNRYPDEERMKSEVSMEILRNFLNIEIPAIDSCVDNLFYTRLLKLFYKMEEINDIVQTDTYKKYIKIFNTELKEWNESLIKYNSVNKIEHASTVIESSRAIAASPVQNIFPFKLEKEKSKQTRAETYFKSWLGETISRLSMNWRSLRASGKYSQLVKELMPKKSP